MKKINLDSVHFLSKGEMKMIGAGGYIEIRCKGGGGASSSGSTMSQAKAYASSLCDGDYTIIQVGMQAPYEDPIFIGPIGEKPEKL
ncbi:hypothetical protein OA93_10305 [Flavobacterium sp. KMS]|uniref:hypothetical protein n=1 Tax=Flavobacterium sp. KMS TaxID=1566023 RepID=UPI00057EBED9|nr:hypothetical protein [Flavobacterium sp. KMS]KIA98175.1 hypothetical protein OA93_10305 [Flavobacterium sp. KMS]